MRLQLRVPVALSLLVLFGASARGQEYQVTDLGALGLVNQPWTVNDEGDVVGWSYFPDGHDEGFFYDGDKVDYIGTPGGTSRSDLLGLNDLGEAAGKSGTVYENGQALRRRANGSIQELGTLGGSRSAGKSINDLGQVVGWSKLVGDLDSRPFVWQDGVMDSLPLLGGTQGSADWINDAGQIVGSSTTDEDGLQQFAVIWEEGSVVRLPPLHPGLANIARFIHDDGSIAGGVRLPADPWILRAAIWRDGQVVLQLGTLADGTPEEPFASSVAQCVNAGGVVVGMSVNGAGANVPFVYRNGVMHQLDDLMPDPWIADYVGNGCLNDAGQIVVSAVYPGEAGSHALLLTPPAPTSAGAAAFHEAAPSLSTVGRRIFYRTAGSGRVTISIYDLLGRLVARPVNEITTAGSHEVVWNGRAREGHRAASGVYFVRMEAHGVDATGRITIVR